MANGFRLGIDYGTSNTVAVLSWPDGRARTLLFDGSPVLPSAVCAAEDGALITGREAQRSARIAPERFEPNPKRRIDELDVLLGDRSYPLSEVVATTLRRVAGEAARTAGGPVADVTITHPVEWGPARRALLTEAAARAGLPRPALVPEPVAAATYFVDVLDHQVPVGRSVVVYDLGGGTFDACVVRRAADGFEPLSYQGLDDFGGVDLDALVVSLVGQVAAQQSPQDWQRLLHPSDPAELRHSRVLWEDARLAKEALSRQNTAGIFVPLLERDVHVTREQFEAGARAALTRTAEVTLSAIRQARVTPADVTGIFLVGGSTRVPMVATLLHREVGVAPTALEQPEIVVAEGALHATRSTISSVPAPPAGMAPAGPFPPTPPVSALPDTSSPVSAPIPPQPTTGAPVSPRSAMPFAASPASAPLNVGSPVPDVSAPHPPPLGPRGAPPPPPNGGTHAFLMPSAVRGGKRSHGHRGVVIAVCAVVFVLLAGGGVTAYALGQHRALPSDIYQNPCRYVDYKPIYTKLGITPPSGTPQKDRYSSSDVVCDQNGDAGKSSINVGTVEMEIERGSFFDDESGDFNDDLSTMEDKSKQRGQYPTKKLNIGDDAAVGPHRTTDPGMQIDVWKSGFLFTVDVSYTGAYSGYGEKAVPRNDLDSLASALTQIAKKSVPEISREMK